MRGHHPSCAGPPERAHGGGVSGSDCAGARAPARVFFGVCAPLVVVRARWCRYPHCYAQSTAEADREALLAERDLSSSNLEVVVKLRQVSAAGAAPAVLVVCRACCAVALHGASWCVVMSALGFILCKRHAAVNGVGGPSPRGHWLLIDGSGAQGQDEIEPEAVVTDYGTAQFIPRAAVERVNKHIRFHGQQKVDVLRKIMERRKNIRLLEWENGHKKARGGVAWRGVMCCGVVLCSVTRIDEQ